MSGAQTRGLVEVHRRLPAPPPLLRRVVLLSAAIAAVWALVSPLGSVPDEPQHVIYAAAVVRGQLGAGERGNEVRVPEPVAGVEQKHCYKFRPEVTADCMLPLSAASGEATAVTGAAHYPPLYYALVGWVTWLPFTEASWYLMRLLTVLLGTALLWAGGAAWQRDEDAVLAGTAVAVGPMASFMLGSVNPNGPEIIAGAAFVLAGTGLLNGWRRDAEGRHGAAVAAVLLTGGYLALARPSTWLLTGALGFVLLLAGLPHVLRALRVQRSGVLAVAGLLGVMALGLLVARLTAGPPGPPGRGTSIGGALSTSLLTAADWLLETGGVFGWRDHTAPLASRLLTVGVLLALTVAGWFAARAWYERLSLLLLSAGALVVGPFYAFLTLFGAQGGYQGRYGMALIQAMPVLGGYLLASHRAPGAPGRRALAGVPVLIVVVQALVLCGSYLRYGLGLPLTYDPRALGDLVWLPPAWPLAVLLLAVALLLAVRVRKGTLALPVPPANAAAPVLRVT